MVTSRYLASEFLSMEHGLLIDGEFVPAAEKALIPVLDPGSEAPIASIAAGGPADIDAAVSSARTAFEDGRWTLMSPDTRSQVLWKVSDLITQRAAQLAELESADNGMPLTRAHAQVAASARLFRYYAGMTDKVYGVTSDVRTDDGGYLGYTLREPIGVVGLIVPWNGPLVLAAKKVAATLAAGCTSVLKPAEEAALTTLWLGEILLEAGVPSGTVNVVTGTGESAGAALAAHADVDKVDFTGSTEVGRMIIKAAAGNLKRVALELGGKSPVVVFGDADLSKAIPAAASAIFGNSGQVCTAGSRLIVERSVQDEVAEGIAAIARRLKLGHYSEPNVDLGPVVSRKQLDRVCGYIESAQRDGAELVAGGETLDRRGFFVQPTVFRNATNTMEFVREEIFGPVLGIIAFDEFEESIRLANDTPYGLAGSVFTSDLRRAHTFARRLRAGRVGINDHVMADCSLPMGGLKQSGWGRENGPEGLHPYLEEKTVVVRLSP